MNPDFMTGMVIFFPVFQALNERGLTKSEFGEYFADIPVDTDEAIQIMQDKDLITIEDNIISLTDYGKTVYEGGVRILEKMERAVANVDEDLIEFLRWLESKDGVDKEEFHDKGHDILHACSNNFAPLMLSKGVICIKNNKVYITELGKTLESEIKKCPPNQVFNFIKSKPTTYNTLFKFNKPIDPSLN